MFSFRYCEEKKIYVSFKECHMCVSMVEVFSTLLYSTMVGRNDEDKLVWLAACSGSFEVKLYYTVLLFDISWVMPK